jgi:hypothetical protein
MSDPSIPDDWDEPATEEDLRWWLDLAPTLTWTWATTFADSAPHWYVAWFPGKRSGLTNADFLRVGRVIRTFGEPGKFWRATNLYLYTADRLRKFWMMWSLDVPRPRNVSVINLAQADQVYGPQTDFDTAWVARMRPEASDRG